jgi:aminoglycoside phosphotransferase (APT) family kinase protein
VTHRIDEGGRVLEGADDEGPEVYRLARSYPTADAVAAVERVLATRVAAAHRSTVGSSHAVFFVALEDGRRCVARVATHPEHALARELWATEVCRRAGVPAPRLLGADLAPSDGSPPLAVHEHLPGEPGHQMALGHDQRAAVLEQMGWIAARIHGIKVAGVGELAPSGDGYAGTESSWCAFTLTALERRLAELRALDATAVAPGLTRAIRRRFALGRSAFEAAVPTGAPSSALVHADLRLQNTLLTRDAAGAVRVSAVLDFEMAVAGDGAIDLAWLHYEDGRGPKDLAAILRGYGASAADTDLQRRLRLYQTHCALGHLWWLVSFRDQAGAAAVLGRIRRLLSDLDRVRAPEPRRRAAGRGGDADPGGRGGRP